MQNILIAAKIAVSCRQYLVFTLPKPCHSIHIISGSRGYKLQILFLKKKLYFHFFSTDRMYTCLHALFVAETKLCFIIILKYMKGMCVV